MKTARPSAVFLQEIAAIKSRSVMDGFITWRSDPEKYFAEKSNLIERQKRVSLAYAIAREAASLEMGDAAAAMEEFSRIVVSR